MKRTLALLIVVGAFAVSVVGIGSAAQSGCFDLTTAQSLRTARILDALPLTPDQVREIRGRLSQYGSLSGYPGIADLGLPPNVVAEINRRIKLQVDEWNRYPLGYPCKPFKNPTRTAKFIRSQLDYNGFYAIKLRRASPRQFQFTATRDGIHYVGAVAKTGPREITISAKTATRGAGAGGRIKTPFEP